MINSKIQKDFNLKNNTTWHLPTICAAYVKISSLEDLKELSKSGELGNHDKHCILGLGANTLFATDKYDGLVIEIDLKGIERLNETNDEVFCKVYSGENWISLVERFVSEGLGGIENLAYIPGKVGAAPVQNIAAYGRAFEEVCESVEIFDLKTGLLSVLSVQDCEFGYRNSIFKKRILEGDNSFVITSVIMRLSKSGHHKIEKSYYSLSENMKDILTNEDEDDNLKKIFESIVNIRKSKLPSFEEIGTNGSLFMNPLVVGKKLKELLKKFPKLQYYPTDKMKYIDNKHEISDTETYKIAAGHIFGQIGWKNKRIGNVGTWQNHALVLCSYGESKPEDVIGVINMMKSDFEQVTGIKIEPEINIIY